MARTSGETKSYPRISAPGELSESTLAFLRRRAPERCVVFASWERLEPEEGNYVETALEALRQELMTVGSLRTTCAAFSAMWGRQCGLWATWRRST